jgi:hypothetical protein
MSNPTFNVRDVFGLPLDQDAVKSFASAGGSSCAASGEGVQNRAAGRRFPALYDYSDTTDWGKYNPDVWTTLTPSINAAHAFQASP